MAAVCGGEVLRDVPFETCLLYTSGTLVVRGAAPQPPRPAEPAPAPAPEDQYAALQRQLRQANDAKMCIRDSGQPAAPDLGEGMVPVRQLVPQMVSGITSNDLKSLKAYLCLLYTSRCV